MKRILQTTAIVTAALTVPAAASAQSYYSTQTAHQACKKKEDKKQLIGGLIGAVAGGVLGSQVSGNGARTEGSAIGAVVGGLAGAGIADKTIDCDPAYPVASGYDTERVYGTSYGSNPGYYQDRVTYSNHPVYSDPTYGAGYGAVRQGQSYNTGTVTYAPQPAYNQGYTTTTYQGQPTYNQGYTTASYPTQPAYRPASLNTYGTTHSSGYITRDVYYQSEPVQPRPLRGARHFHGPYVCNDFH